MCFFNVLLKDNCFYSTVLHNMIFCINLLVRGHDSSLLVVHNTKLSCVHLVDKQQ